MLERWWNPFKKKTEPMGSVKGVEVDLAIERRERASKFVEILRTRGWAEMQAPTNHPPIRLFAVCRMAKNPECPTGTIDISRHAALGYFMYGFTEAYVLDLVAEFPMGSGVFIPVGHRDVKITRFDQPDKPVKANGNFAIQRNLFKEWQTNALPRAFDSVLKIGDDIYGMNGVEVVAGVTPGETEDSSSGIDVDLLAEYYKQHHIPLATSWRGKGMGKLLIGLELELLRQRGVQELHLESVSDDLARIFGKIPQKNSALYIQSLPPDTSQSLIGTFLPKEL